MENNAINNFDKKVYVSITGLQLKRHKYIVRFFWHTLCCMIQAYKAPGNIKASISINDK